MAIGCPHPRLLPLTSSDLADWIAFNRVELIGDQRADLRMGILAQTTLLPYLKKGFAPPKPTEFMPFYTVAPPTPEVINLSISRAIDQAKRCGKRKAKTV